MPPHTPRWPRTGERASSSIISTTPAADRWDRSCLMAISSHIHARQKPLEDLQLLLG